jgi:hypothetical protein
MCLKILVLLLALLASFALSFLTACDKEPDTLDTTAKPKYNYFPLEVGNYWVYYVGFFEVGPDWIMTDTMSVIGDTVINNRSYSIIKNFFNYNYPECKRNNEYFRYDLNGSVYYFKDKDQELIRLKNPEYEDTFRLANIKPWWPDPRDSVFCKITNVDSISYNAFDDIKLNYPSYKFKNIRINELIYIRFISIYFAQDCGIIYYEDTRNGTLAFLLKEANINNKLYHFTEERIR